MALSREDGPARPRGRPRDHERHRATIRATIEVLRECGYDKLSIAEVSRRAGVGRQLIYQWWGTKAALVVEALLGRDPQAPREYPGPFESDIRLLITEMVEHFSRPEMQRGLPGLMDVLSHDQQLMRVLNERYTEPLYSRYQEVVSAGIARREVRADLDAIDLVDTLRGAVVLHVQTHPARSRGAIVDHLVKLVWQGVKNEPSAD